MVGRYPFAVTVLFDLLGFVQILGVEAHYGKRKDDLEKPKDKIENVLQAEARASAISEAHGKDFGLGIGFALCFFVMKRLQRNVRPRNVASMPLK